MQVTTNTSTSRSSIIAGSVLMVIGGAALISQLFPQYDRYIPLIIGLSLAAVFAFTRNYVVLVFGGILTGLGVGLVGAQAFPTNVADGAGAVLGLGIGFVSVWVVGRLMSLPEHHFWPLIPGFILTAVGTGLAADAFSSDLGELFVPVVALALGLLFVIGGLIAGRHKTGSSSVQ